MPTEEKLGSSKMSGTKPSETKPRRMVGRSIAVALGIICVVLVASLAGTVMVFTVENTNLQNQVNDLTNIVNHEKTVSEICLNNKTLSLSPQANVSVFFYTPYSGDVLVDAIIKPPNPNIWINLTWYVYYGTPPRTCGFSLNGYEDIFEDNASNYHIQEEFPMVAFGQLTNIPNVVVAFGNNSTDTPVTANVTITLYY